MTRKQRKRLSVGQQRLAGMSVSHRAETLTRVEFLSRKGRMPSGTVGSSIAPPRDIQATRRYKLPTKKEVFTYAQQYGDQVKQVLPTLRPLN